MAEHAEVLTICASFCDILFSCHFKFVQNQNLTIRLPLNQVHSYMVICVPDDKLRMCLKLYAQFVEDIVSRFISWKHVIDQQLVAPFFSCACHLLCHQWLTRESFVHQAVKKSEISRQGCGGLRNPLSMSGGGGENVNILSAGPVPEKKWINICTCMHGLFTGIVCVSDPTCINMFINLCIFCIPLICIIMGICTLHVCFKSWSALSSQKHSVITVITVNFFKNAVRCWNNCPL